MVAGRKPKDIPGSGSCTNEPSDHSVILSIVANNTLFVLLSESRSVVSDIL